jgi:hypothetical protein
MKSTSRGSGPARATCVSPLAAPGSNAFGADPKRLGAQSPRQSAFAQFDWCCGHEPGGVARTRLCWDVRLTWTNARLGWSRVVNSGVEGATRTDTQPGYQLAGTILLPD